MNAKMVILSSTLVMGLFASGASAGLFGLFGDDEEKIAVKDLPPAVTQTVQRVFPQGEIKRAEKEEKASGSATRSKWNPEKRFTRSKPPLTDR
jgi:hypothetical protein